MQKKKKNKYQAVLLCYLLGWLGVHRFYLGQKGLGMVYLVFSWTLIPLFFSFFETFFFLFMTEEEFDRRYNMSRMLPPGRPEPLQMTYTGMSSGAGGGYGGYPADVRYPVPFGTDRSGLGPGAGYGQPGPSPGGEPPYGGQDPRFNQNYDPRAQSQFQPQFQSQGAGAPYGVDGTVSGSGSSWGPSPGQGSSPENRQSELAHYFELRISGMISEEEYQSQRLRLMRQA